MRTTALVWACLACTSHGNRAKLTSVQMQDGSYEELHISQQGDHSTSSSHALAELEQSEASARAGVPRPWKALAMLLAMFSHNNLSTAFTTPHLRPVTMTGHKLSLNNPRDVRMETQPPLRPEALALNETSKQKDDLGRFPFDYLDYNFPSPGHIMRDTGLNSQLEESKTTDKYKNRIEAKRIKEFGWLPPAKVKLMQFNMLADGLAIDGFMTPRNGDSEQRFFERVRDTIALIRVSKESLSAGEKLSKEDVLDAARREEKLGRLLSSAELDAERLNEMQVLAWPIRRPQILDMVAKADADVITFQEMDKYPSLVHDMSNLGYTSVMDGRSSTLYDEKGMRSSRLLAIETGLTKAERRAIYRDQIKELASAGIAFAPNLDSNARKIALKENMLFGFDRRNGFPDDQGVAIFWKKSTFRLDVEPEMTLIGDKQDSVAMKVVLTHRPTNQQMAIMTAHLSSSVEKELQRHKELQDMFHLVQTEDLPVIFAADLNSEIWFDGDQPRAPPEGIATTCFDMITGNEHIEEHGNRLEQWGMHSVWGHSLGHKTGRAPPTVFKMRGPGSNQPHKMGEVEFQTIDHVFYKGSGVKLRSVSVPGSTLPALTKQQLCAYRNALQNENVDGDMAIGVDGNTGRTILFKELLSQMLPTEANPSDHFPVVVEFEVEVDHPEIKESLGRRLSSSLRKLGARLGFTPKSQSKKKEKDQDRSEGASDYETLADRIFGTAPETAEFGNQSGVR